MKVYNEIDLREFVPWSGAKGVYYRLTDDELSYIDDLISDCFPDGMTETSLNDLFWFDDEWILDILSIDYDEFWNRTPRRIF